MLQHVWPANGQGSILVTTRDLSAVSNLSSHGYHVQPFGDTDGSEVLLRLVGLDAKIASNQEKAIEITRALGGLPLALNQIGGFIQQRRLPLQDFLPLYERNSAKIDARKTGISGYEHTLSTVWGMSFSRLSEDAQSLLGILSYMQPDAIDEEVLRKGQELLEYPRFKFLGDEMEYAYPSSTRCQLTACFSLGDAEEVLLKLGLINKSPEAAIITVHRLIQTTVIRNQSDADKAELFGSVIRLLNWGFPDTWSEDVGSQFRTWSQCEKCLPHVLHLVEQRDKYKVLPEDHQRYGELLLQCSW